MKNHYTDIIIYLLYIKYIMNIPKTVFIVPYRDRLEHKKLFEEAMGKNLSDLDNYKIYYIHQKDKRLFNRGAMKNIGFLLIKRLYPDNYKDITFIFHDIDTYGQNKHTIDYKTENGIVKHYYGYDFALGGIFAIKGSDFEIATGFPNFWGWGLEDNVLNDRCLEKQLIIDRSQFYIINDKENIIQNFDQRYKIYNNRNICIYLYEKPDCLYDITNIRYYINSSYNNFIMVDITTYNCSYSEDDLILSKKDTLRGNKLILERTNCFRKNWNMNTIIKPKTY